jgi:hypothetical protein
MPAYKQEHVLRWPNTRYEDLLGASFLPRRKATAPLLGPSRRFAITAREVHEHSRRNMLDEQLIYPFWPLQPREETSARLHLTVFDVLTKSTKARRAAGICRRLG